MLRFLCACCVAVLSGMGVGGGGLLILYLTFLENRAQLYAQGVNLLFFLLCAAGAMPVHLRHHKPETVALVILCVSGAAGAVCGSLLTQVIPVSLLRKLFGAFLASGGILVLLDTRNAKKIKKNQDAV